MAAPTDLIGLRDRRSGAKCTIVRLIELSSGGFHASAAQAPSAGEEIRVDIPAIGPVNARVISADDREFRAEFCGATDLRLLFLRKSAIGCSSSFERRSA
jgi:hypothetical protein